MQRHEVIDAMRVLGLKGMAGAFDEAVTAGIQRKRTASEILTDLLRAETAYRHAASIRYRMTAAKLPMVKDLDAFVFDGTPINEDLVRSLHAGALTRLLLLKVFAHDPFRRSMLPGISDVRAPDIKLGIEVIEVMVRISEVLDSRFTKSRTCVSLSPGQSAQFGHRCLVVVQAVMISAFSMSVKRGAGRVLRMLSPSSVMRWALCTRRSRMASAIVGAPIISCH